MGLATTNTGSFARLDVEIVRELLGYYGADELMGIFRDYLRELTALVEQSLLFLEKKDYAPLGRAMHTLKGSSRTVGAVRVAALAADVERSSGRGRCRGSALRLLREEGEAFLREAEVFLSTSGR